MGLLLRPNEPLLRAAAGSTTPRDAGFVDLRAERSLDPDRVVGVEGAPMNGRPSGTASHPQQPVAWSDTMQALLRLSRLHRVGKLSDRDFTVAVNRLLGT